MVDLAIGIMSLLTLVAVNIVLFMPMRQTNRKDIIRTVALWVFIWEAYSYRLYALQERSRAY